jgi:N-acetylneuraminic acid mutarotase
LKHVRFATMAEGFVRDTVRAWPALLSAGGQGVLSSSLAPVVGGVQPSPRLGFGPRRIYLLGGSNDEGALSTVLAYDPALDSWCEVASMAMKRCRHVAAALGGKLYVMGGYDVGEEMPLAEVEVFDPKANGWQPVPSMPTARRAFAAAAVAGKVYAIGGLDDNSELCDAVEAYDPLFGAWTQVASLPVARGYHTAAVVDGKMYVLGGEFIDDEGYQVATDRVDVYDPAADSWQQMAAMPTARESAAAAVVSGKIYVSGGFTTSRDLSDAFEAYDPVTNTWATLASLSEARADHASAAAHGKLYVFGGWASGDGLDLVEVYSPASNSWARAADLTSAIDEVVAVAL